MAIDFPSSPSVGQQYTFNGLTYEFIAQGMWKEVLASNQPLDATLTALAAYNTDGLLTQTAADTFTGRTLTGPAAGITVTNGSGVAGNPTLVLANDLAALEGLTGTNTIPYRSGTDTWAGVTVGTGLTFSGGNLTATASAGGFTSVVVQKFTASGTYTPTASMKYCLIECVGGGGGGGGGTASATASIQGGGGGSGGYSRLLASAAAIGASKAVTIGAGSSGAGGVTSVGSLCISNGGGQGGGGSTGAQPACGTGASVSGAVGDVTVAGVPGGFGLYSNSNGVNPLTGNGGCGPFGGGGTSIFAGTGGAGTGPGAGGAGGHSHATTTGVGGGAGAAGIVIVTEFI